MVVITAPTDGPLMNSASGIAQVGTRGSNDATNWQILDVRNVSSGTNGSTFTIPINLSNNAPYRYNQFCVSGDGAANVRISQVQFYTTADASTRRLALYGGMPVNDALITGARINTTTTINIAQYQGTYLGSFKTDPAAAGQVTSHLNFGASRAANLYNLYNQHTTTLQAGIPCLTSGLNCNYNLSSPGNIDWGPIQNTTFSMSVLIGYKMDPLTVFLPRTAYLQGGGISAPAGGYECGIGVDTTAGFSGTGCALTQDTGGSNLGLGANNATVTLPPFAGSHIFYGVEKLAYLLSTGGTISVFADVRNSKLLTSFRN